MQVARKSFSKSTLAFKLDLQLRIWHDYLIVIKLVTMRFCLFFIVVSLSCELTTVCAEEKTKEKVYYKRTENVHLAANETIAKNGNVTMEAPAPTPLIKKDAAKIKPRKGVLPNKSDEKVDQTDSSLLDQMAIKPVSEKSDEVTVASESKKPTTETTKMPSTTQKPTSTSLHSVSVHEKHATNMTTVTVKKFNPKPTVTYAEKESDDESMPPFPTNKSPLGTPRKIDYIVPVIITITALPLLGVAFYVLFKRGRDYWDKRHYRRMDFLIDGMYNE